MITARSREIVALFDKYTAPADEGGLALKSSAAITSIAEELDVSVVTVSTESYGLATTKPYDFLIANDKINLKNKSS